MSKQLVQIQYGQEENNLLDVCVTNAYKDAKDNQIDTTYATNTNLESHTSNTTTHITATERTNWNDANSKKHTHSNKTILDNTTASYTTEEQEKLSGIKEGAETTAATISGSNPTVTNSANAPLIYGKIKGYTLQEGEPTPDNPIDIKGLGDSGTIEVKTCGKNRLKIKTTTITKDGITFTVNEDGTITINGTSTTDIDFDVNYSANVTGNGNIKSKLFQLNGSYTGTVKHYAYDSKYWYGVSVPIGEDGILKTDVIYNIFRIKVISGTVCNNLKVGFMVAQDVSEYEPYTETTATIPIDTLYEGDYLEVYADGSGKIVGTRGSVVYDGSDDEKFTLTTINSYGIANFGISLVAKGGNAISSHFPHKETLINSAKSEGIFNNNTTLYIRTKQERISTVSELKIWLQSNPVTVNYELATPTETPLTAEQVEQFKQLYTFNNVTNFFCDGEITARYYVNTDSGDTVGMLQEQVKAIPEHLADTNNPHGVTKAQVGLGNVDNTSDINKPVSTAQATAIADAKSAGTTAQTNLASHTSNTTAHITATERSNWNDANSKKHTHSNKTILDNTTASYTTTEKTKLSGIATGAEVNQNAFSNVVIGTTTISADSKTDSLTLAGSNVTLTPDATNDKVTIGITKANVTTALGYTPPTTNTTYGVATSSTLGLVKSGTDITVDSSGNVSVNDDSHNHTIANVDGLQTALDGKAVKKELASENLNDIKTPGFYNAGGNNSVTNKPSGVDHFGLYVVKRASGDYYTQILIDNNKKQYRRHCENGTWGSWAEDKLTDTNTTYSAATTSASGLMTAAMVTKLNGIATGANAYSHPTSSGNKHIPSGGSSGQILRWSADGTAVWGNDNNTTYSNFVKSGSGAKAGLVPAPSTTAGTTKYLREDGTWAVPPDTNTTYTSLKNPYALKIQGNGTTLTNGTYDGSAAKTINITPSSIGAAASSHTHNYAGSSSAGGAATTALKCTGNSATATKLATARTINGVSFNGTSDIYLPSGRRWWVGSDAANSAGWYLFMEKTMSQHEDFNITLSVTSEYASSTHGMLNIYTRSDSPTASGTPTIRWMYRKGWSADHIMAVVSGSKISFYAYLTPTQWGKICFQVVSESSRGSGTSYTTKSSSSPTKGLTATTTSSDGATVYAANKLATARTISLTGSVTGSGTFDGSGNLSIATTTNHGHSEYYSNAMSRTANTVLAAPNGSAGTATFRKLVVSDLPTGTSSTTVALGNHTHSYLPLSGGTLTISSYYGLTIKRSDANGSAIAYSNSNGALGGAGFLSNGSFQISSGSNTNGNIMLANTTSAIFPGTVTATTFTGALSGNASTATKLATARTIDGVSFNGTAAITHYGTCSTAAGTAAKTVALTGFTLVTGARVSVKFTVTNTAASPTLNVNSTGAKAIMYRGSAITAGYLAANRVYEFVYDGTDWELVGDINTDTNTTYTSLKNPYALTIKGNGTTLTNGTYDGSAAKTINITPSSIGAAASSHGTHVTYGTSASALGTSSAGSASTVSRSDHVHALPALTSCTGTLTVAKGGTGATTAKAAEYNILSGMTEVTSEISDTTQITYVYTSPSTTQGRLYWRKASTLWTYIKSKTDSIYLPLSGGNVTGNITMGRNKAAATIVPYTSGYGAIGTSSQTFDSSNIRCMYCRELQILDPTYNGTVGQIRYNANTAVMYKSATNTESKIIGLDIYSNYNMRLYTSGYIYMNGTSMVSANLFTYSDEKVKNFTDDIDDDKDELIKLFDIINLKSYHYKYNKSNSLALGFSAQDIEAACIEIGIDPEKYNILNIEYGHMMSRGADIEDSKYYTKFYSVSYNDLYNLSLLKIKSIEKEHIKRLDSLEERLSMLENK